MVRTALIALAVMVSCLCLGSSVDAGITSISSTAGGNALGGMNYLNFNGLVLGQGSPRNLGNGVSLLLNPEAAVVKVPNTSQYAAPWLTGTNNLYFGDSTANDSFTGQDITEYITSGKISGALAGSATLTFATPQLYFGLLWGSVDTYNYLSFYKNNVLVGVVNGSQVNSPANGNQFAQGTTYVNIFTDGYDKVVATSDPSYAFEFDNVAYGIPEPAAMLAWGVLGLVGVIVVRRNRRRA